MSPSLETTHSSPSSIVTYLTEPIDVNQSSETLVNASLNSSTFFNTPIGPVPVFHQFSSISESPIHWVSPNFYFLH
jgi:hypothetical protein